MKTDPHISYGDWFPSVEKVTETIDLTQVRKLAGVLDLDETSLKNGSHLPPMWHWLFFLHRAATGNIGIDGHPKRGGFFPPIELQRRMFAGEQIKYHNPLLVGLPATRTGTITRLDEKKSKNGRMMLVTATYIIEQEGKICVEDKHDIVYIDGGEKTPTPGHDSFLKPDDNWYRIYKADPVLLFRYSALSFNSHRIHYDSEYAENEEGYPGLVVHGPFTALLLAELARANIQESLTEFNFRGRAPLFEPWSFHLIGKSDNTGVAELQAVRNDSVIAMTATAKFG